MDASYYHGQYFETVCYDCPFNDGRDMNRKGGLIMEQYQIRLIEEYRELDGRIRRLSSYLMRRADELTAAPGEVTDRDFSDFCLMFRQLRIMAEYRQIIYTRLDAMHLDPCSSAPDEIAYIDTDSFDT